MFDLLAAAPTIAALSLGGTMTLAIGIGLGWRVARADVARHTQAMVNQVGQERDQAQLEARAATAERDFWKGQYELTEQEDPRDLPATPTYHVPGPYEIALAVGAALATSGRYDTPGAAMAAAWVSVPEFFAGRDLYLRDIVPILFPEAAAGQAKAAPAGEDRHVA